LSRVVKSPLAGPTTRYFEHINRFSASFAFATDVAMLSLGGYLKKKENLSARLGDVLSSLYLASMVLKHYENQGRPAVDLPLVEYACRSLLYQAQEQLHSFLRNFPIRWLAGLMRLVIFPRGLTYSAPSDRLNPQIAELMMNPGEARERLCHYVYRTLEPGNHLGLVQQAMELAIAAEPILKRIRVEGVKTGKVTALDLPGQIREAQEARVITEAEAAQLREYDRKVMDVIDVDDFEPRELVAGSTYEIQLDGGQIQVA
jgi:acyl-CoA dehydrogenase